MLGLFPSPFGMGVLMCGRSEPQTPTPSPSPPPQGGRERA